MKQRIRKILVALLLIVTLSCNHCNFVRGTDEETISLRYTNISTLSAGLTINSSNVANCMGSVTITKKLKSRMYVSLYKSASSGSYSRIKMWAQDFSGMGNKTMSKNYTVARGYNYKIKVEVRIYNSAGTVIETAEKYSVTVDNT